MPAADEKPLLLLNNGFRARVPVLENRYCENSMDSSLRDALKGKVVIMGIGNIMCGDDGFGPCLIADIKEKVKAACIDAGTAPENYIGKAAKMNPDAILLVDAVHLNMKPGEYDILKKEDIVNSGLTTHDISFEMLIGFLKSQTNAKIYLLGIQPANIRLGDEMSGSVKKTLIKITELIKEELKNA